MAADPKTVRAACTEVGKLLPGSNLEGKVNKCVDVIARAEHRLNSPDQQRRLACFSEYKGPEAQGKCLRDRIWPEPKPYTGTADLHSPAFGKSDQPRDSFPMFSLRFFTDK